MTASIRMGVLQKQEHAVGGGLLPFYPFQPVPPRHSNRRNESDPRFFWDLNIAYRQYSDCSDGVWALGKGEQALPRKTRLFA